jgi:hypothetical protein
MAAVEVVWDRESDVVYVSRTHRMSEATPPGLGSKATQLGGMPPQSMAKLLMWELANEQSCCG